MPTQWPETPQPSTLSSVSDVVQHTWGTEQPDIGALHLVKGFRLVPGAGGRIHLYAVGSDGEVLPSGALIVFKLTPSGILVYPEANVSGPALASFRPECRNMANNTIKFVSIA